MPFPIFDPHALKTISDAVFGVRLEPVEYLYNDSLPFLKASHALQVIDREEVSATQELLDAITRGLTVSGRSSRMASGRITYTSGGHH